MSANSKIEQTGHVVERPLLFSGPMAVAVLRDVEPKTQTRRGVTRLTGFGQITEFGPSDTPGYDWHFRDRAMRWHDISHARLLECCPYGKPGQRLWVRETHAKIIGQSGGWIETDYRATYTHGDRLGDLIGVRKKWTPAIHMPRAASRIDLEITDMRIERLQDISEADAWAEGCRRGQADDVGGFFPAEEPLPNGKGFRGWDNARDWYADLWEEINGDTGPVSWDGNPWVWAITFKRVKPAIAGNGRTAP